MRKQCLMVMLLLAASEHAEKNPLEIKISKGYCRFVQTQNVSHLSNNHLFLPHMLLCGLGVYT